LSANGVISGETFSATISADNGYKLPQNITGSDVSGTHGTVTFSRSSETSGTITIANVTSSITINADAVQLGSYQITFPAASSNVLVSDLNGNPLTSPISVSELNNGWSCKVSAASGYALSAAPTVTMGTDTVTPTLNGDGSYTVSIQQVTGDVSINASVEVHYIDITNTLTNCETSNNADQMAGGQTYSATITPKNGYILKSVTVNGTPQAITGNSCAISIANANSDLTIVAQAVLNIVTGKIIHRTGAEISSTDGSYTQGLVDLTGWKKLKIVHNYGRQNLNNPPYIVFYNDNGTVKSSGYWEEGSNNAVGYNCLVSRTFNSVVFSSQVTGTELTYIGNFMKCALYANNGSFADCLIQISLDGENWIDIFNGATDGSYAIDGVIFNANND
jgi:hypothetical protein